MARERSVPVVASSAWLCTSDASPLSAGSKRPQIIRDHGALVTGEIAPAKLAL
jgi:hypothetical protein